MRQSASVDRALAAVAKDESKKLGVSINNQTITTGQYFARAETQNAPQLNYNVPDKTAKYIVIALDLDAPFQGWTGLGPILHWIQPGLTASDGSDKLVAKEPFVANWIAAAPPPMSGPHRYSFYLFRQPMGFDGSKYAPPNGQNMGNFPRVRFDLDAWMKKAGLEEPIAANYFTSN